ncbi:MAG: type VI secretion system Vgr family protein [Hyphomicrobiales bacterium]
MALKARQDSRVAKFTTPLGTDVLVLERFDGREGLSELFEFHVDALSDAQDNQKPIDFDAVIGNNCCVSIKNYDGSERHFNGVLTETQWRGTESSYQNTFHAYSLVLRPWLWMLSRVSDCYIFAEKTIPQIIKEILNKPCYPADFKDSLSGSYKELEYCVQYRETDLQFVCRLMEEAGIHYFFEHSESGHKLILADTSTACEPKQGGSKLVYRQLTGTDRREEEILHTWLAGRRFASGKFALNDYNYMKPGADLLSEREDPGAYRHANLERYDYPGRFEEKSVGTDYAGFRLEAEQAMDHRYRAAGDAVSCCPGTSIKLAEHPDGSQNIEYLIVHAGHAFSSNYYRSGAGADSQEIYSGHYDFLPKDIPFRMPQLTPKPVIHGLQTAKVAGEGEIDVDKHGRIIVHFYWDREKKNSRRVRIAQVWSGKSWGAIVIPRVGMEVVVEFVDGDPDRPLVTGTVYNADNTVPYDLPGEKTIAGVKSNSSEGGGGYNEFVFDDKAGGELIRMHGQKDMEAKIENDVTKDVGNDQTETIGNVWKVTAISKIEFVVGASKIVMDPKSITIESLTITIKAMAQLDAKSPLTTVEGSGILTLKGGLVLIN